MPVNNNDKTTKNNSVQLQILNKFWNKHHILNRKYNTEIQKRTIKRLKLEHSLTKAIQLIILDY